MGDGDSNNDEESVLRTQALLITVGPFKGRICLNDDDAFMHARDLTRLERAWMNKAGIQWRKLTPEAGYEDQDTDIDWWEQDGADFEIVTFGYYGSCRSHHYIPRQFLAPATMNDLFERYDEIKNVVGRSAWAPDQWPLSDKKAKELLLEQVMIIDEVWSRELKLRNFSGNATIFLCHSSTDKPTVRRVCSDLAEAGHKAWLDEFEIKVGDSIVDKINGATTAADAVVLFISKSSLTSGWVNREWQSTLARSLSGKSTKILPALLEDCEVPALLADLKYADFRQSYREGLESLLASFPQAKSATPDGPAS